MNVLIIEDDVYLASKIWEVFENSVLTNRVKTLHSYIDFLNELSNIDAYDIVLTDIMLGWPDEKTGIDILKVIRRKNLELPIIIISSLSSYDSLESAFSIGANDYIIKPFRIRELEIRVNKWFQDYIFSIYSALNKRISYKEVVYDISKSEFYFNEKKMPLTKSNKYVFSLFLIYAEKLISEQFLIRKIWWDNEEISPSRNTRIIVLRLKERLEQYWLDQRIQNVRWEWYILQKP